MRTIRVALVGDVMLGRLVDDYLVKADPCYVWGDTTGLFQDVDLSLCNLECVLADSGSPWSATPKVFHFRSHSKNVAALGCVGINVVTLANNHTLDFGYKALKEMLGHLTSAHISRAGAGLSSKEAERPALLKVDNFTIGILSFTDDMPEWAASKQQYGLFHVPRDPASQSWEKLLDVVRSAKTHAGFLIVSPHWGPNLGYEVQAIYTIWAHNLIDAGADMIFGHSGHVFRAVEIYKNKPIIYSAGDFIDDYAIDDEEPNDEGFVYILEIKYNQPLLLKLYPIVIQNFQAQTAKTRAPSIANKLLRLSAKFGTTGAFDRSKQLVTIPISQPDNSNSILSKGEPREQLHNSQAARY